MTIDVDGQSYEYPLTMPDGWDWYVVGWGTKDGEIKEVIIGDNNDRSHLQFEDGTIVDYSTNTDNSTVSTYVKTESTKKSWWQLVKDWVWGE